MKTRLQELRKAAGFRSAKSFAEKIGVSVGTYTDWEQGRRTPTLERAWMIADHLECTLDELAGRDFRPESPTYTDSREAELHRVWGELSDRGKSNVLHDARAEASLERGGAADAPVAGTVGAA